MATSPAGLPRWAKKPRQVSAVSAADIIPDDDELFDDELEELDELDETPALIEDREIDELADEPAKPKKKRKKKNRKKRSEDKKRREEDVGAEAAPARTLRPVTKPTPPSVKVAGAVETVADPGVTGERKIALFIDFENIALGIRESPKTHDFDIGLFLERLLEKGKITVKRAYADWHRYGDLKSSLHEAAVELIDIPQKFYAGKTAADIKLVVDALDVCFTKPHLDTFVLVSGDEHFVPLVSKLKENDKYVIGLGLKSAASNLLIDNCDEFIYYEDAERQSRSAPRLEGSAQEQADDKAECFQLLIDSMTALLRENKGVLWSSAVKRTMKRKKPSFNEGALGYSSFTELLQDAERRKIIRLKKDRRSRSYIVEAVDR